MFVSNDNKKLPFFRSINNDGTTDTGRWYITEFSNEQLECRLHHLEQVELENVRLKAKLNELEEITNSMEKTLEIVGDFTQSLDNLLNIKSTDEFDDDANYHPDDFIDFSKLN